MLELIFDIFINIVSIVVAYLLMKNSRRYAFQWWVGLLAITVIPFVIMVEMMAIFSHLN